MELSRYHQKSRTQKGPAFLMVARLGSITAQGEQVRDNIRHLFVT